MKRNVVPFILSSAIVLSSLALTPLTIVNANDNQEVYEEVNYDEEEDDEDVEDTEEENDEDVEDTEEDLENETDEEAAEESEEDLELIEDIEEAVLAYVVTNEISRNIDGNQGEVQLEYTLEDLEENTELTLTISDFTNEMDSINIAVRVDGEVLAVGLELAEGDELTFELPEEYIGRTLTVTASTNSESQGQVRLDLTNN